MGADEGTEVAQNNGNLLCLQDSKKVSMGKKLSGVCLKGWVNVFQGNNMEKEQNTEGRSVWETVSSQDLSGVQVQSSENKGIAWGPNSNGPFT